MRRSGSTAMRRGGLCSLCPPKKLVKNDSLIRVAKDAIIEMAAHGPSEDDLFQIATLTNQVVHGVSMGYAHDVLIDNGTFI